MYNLGARDYTVGNTYHTIFKNRKVVLVKAPLEGDTWVYKELSKTSKYD